MSKLETNTIDTVSGTTNLTIGSTNTSTITMPNGALSGQNYPAFEAYLSANTTVTDATWVKIQANTEVYDTDNAFDNSTNYRFTPQVAGKYFVYASAYCFGNTTNTLVAANLSIYKNGSFYREIYFNNTNNYAYTKNPYISAVIDLNGSSDYLEAYVNINAINAAQLLTGRKSTYFGAYRIGA